jgi:SAM-dependent methyltransferase
MISDDERRRLAGRFDLAADRYERARPEYAPAAMDWLLPTNARRVLDLAAGTGKLTASLAGRDLDVIAIDPSTQMLAQLRARFPGVDARIGSAESIGLPAAAVDAVVIGSALHWFDRPAADHEIARVLRPGGVVGVFGNRRDRSVPWVVALEELLHQLRPERERPSTRTQPAFDPQLFTAPESASFPFTQTLDADSLAELIATRSYVIDMPSAASEPLLADIRRLARTHPDLAGHDTFELPYLTVVRRSIRR